jgi:DsbC/DsbD-like thiol-disulfide interchange protein
MWLGLHFTLSPGWHVYWKNSGDAGLPPALDLSATPELSGAELLWPAPERYELPGSLVAYGYGEEVVYPVRARIEADRGSIAIAARVDYLVCKIDCVPHGYDLKLEQPVGATPEPDPATAPLLERWRARLPVALEPGEQTGAGPGISTRARLEMADPEHPVLWVSVDGARAATSEPTDLFLAVHDLFDPERPQLEPRPGGLAFRLPLRLKRKLDHAPTTSHFDWTVTGLTTRPSGEAAKAEKVFSLEAQGDVPVVSGGEGAAARTEPASEPGEAAARRRPAEPPTLLAAAAILAVVMALWLWGLLGGPAGPATWRPVLGFLAAALAVGALYRLAGRIGAVHLAFTELALLVLALAGWLFGKARRPAGRWLAAALLAASAAAAWLAAVG